MAHRRHETNTKRVEFLVPTKAEWGVPAAELVEAIKEAEKEYRELTKLPDDAPTPRDAVRAVSVEDGEVIFFTVTS